MQIDFEFYFITMLITDSMYLKGSKLICQYLLTNRIVIQLQFLCEETYNNMLPFIRSGIINGFIGSRDYWII